MGRPANRNEVDIHPLRAHPKQQDLGRLIEGAVIPGRGRPVRARVYVSAVTRVVAMPPTNREVRALIARLDRQIEVLQAHLSGRHDVTAAHWVESLKLRRYVLARGLLNRRLE